MAIQKGKSRRRLPNMKKNSILRVGFDDTDSRTGMCTTYLAYKIVNFLKKEKVEFLDYPHLIRFNPNIPWKTRGNGAIALSFRTSNPDKIKSEIKEFVLKYSDINHGANPGLVFYENKKIPENITQFSELALWKLIKRKHVKKFVSENELETLSLGNGQGLVGAVAAIGHKFVDHTFEILAYRKKSEFGKKREIDKKSVKIMQEKTYPYTFNSYDPKSDKILIAPHGPDPVFYGVRGENPKSVIHASKMIRCREDLEGYMTFKTNQGTGDHFKNELCFEDLTPFTSGTITGQVSTTPVVQLGGHVIFSLIKNKKPILCVVYRPTGFSRITQKLLKGDIIQVGGGIRKASKKHTRIMNVEFLEIFNLVKDQRLVNPSCRKCNKRMKSKGRFQGFQCVKCGDRKEFKETKNFPRSLEIQLYLPKVTAHRHLTRPLQRVGRLNKKRRFDDFLPWVHSFQN